MEFSCMSHWETHNPLSAPHAQTYGTAWRTVKSKDLGLCARGWPLMKTLLLNSTRCRAWKHFTTNMQCNASKKHFKKSKAKTPASRAWMTAGCVLKTRQCCVVRQTSLMELPDQRVFGLASEYLCKFSSMFQAMLRSFIAAVLLCTFYVFWGAKFFKKTVSCDWKLIVPRKSMDLKFHVEALFW